MIIGYYLVFVLYYQRMYPPSGNRLVFVLLTFIFLCTMYLSFERYGVRWLSFPTAILVIGISLRITTAMNSLQAAHGAILSVTSVYCFRGIFAAGHVLLSLSGNDPLHNAFMYDLLTAFAIPAALLYFYLLRRTKLSDRRMKLVIDNKRLLWQIVIYQILAAVTLMIINAGRQFISEARWYSMIALCIFVITLGMLIYAVINSADIMELTEYKWSTKVLEEQYALQLRHYKVYEKYTKEFRIFQHDFNRLMPTMKTLIENGKNSEAIQFMEQISGVMQETVHIHKKYSNNVVLDAILQDLANLCDEKSIRYQFQVVTPAGTELSMLDAIRVLSNLSTNAVEACGKVPAQDRFINITSWSGNGWMTLMIENSFDGNLHMLNGRPVTTKKDYENHGLGIASVQEILERLHGLIRFAADREQKIFTVTVHLPKENMFSNKK